MAYGLKIINPNTDVIQIDENYYNLLLRQSGNFAGTGGASSIAYNDGATPVIAMRPTAGFAGLGAVNITGDDYAFNTLEDGSIGSYPYWVFDEVPPSADMTDYGLAVFHTDGSGKLAFHHSYAPMNIVDSFTWAVDSTVDMTYPSGRTYACVWADPGAYTKPGSPDGMDYYIPVCKWTGTTVRIQPYMYLHTPLVTPATFLPGYRINIIDVTNL